MNSDLSEPDVTDPDEEREVMVELVAVEPEPVVVLIPAPLPRAQHPAAAYLQSLSPGSRRTMTLALNTIAALLGIPRQDDADGHNNTYLAAPWHQLRFQHTTALRAHLAERYAPATANRMLAALRQVLVNARRLGLMSADDCANACDLKPVTGSRIAPGRVLEPEEIDALLEACAGDSREQGRRDGALIATLRSTGMRRSEIVGLMCQDYTPETAQLIIRAGKGNKDRTAYLHDGAVAWLADWLALLGSVTGPIFVPIGKGGRVRRGTHLTDQSVRYILNERAQQVGITRSFTAHDFRRTLISNLLEKGIDIATVQRLVGHADVSTTSKYDRRGEVAKRRAIGVLDVPYGQWDR